MPELPPHSPSFKRLVATQFLTVFNDNAFKQIVLLLAVAQGTDLLGADPQAGAGLVFAVPFLLFAVFAGDLADRYSKRGIVLATKWAEAGVMLLAALALALASTPLGLAALFLMGAQSAFLGPAKYGMIPELVPERELSRANGVFNAWVVGGILLGIGASGFLVTGLGSEWLWVSGLAFSAVAAVGALVARGIQPLPAADPGRVLRLNPTLRLKAGLELAARIPGLRGCMLGRSLFYHVGAVVLFAWNEIGSSILQVPEDWWTAGLASLTISLGFGSYLAGRLSRGRPRPGLSVGSAAVMGAGFLAVALGPRDPWFILGVMLATNFFTGMYLVPLMTLIQQLPAKADRGRIQGASQMLDWIFIVAASLAKMFATWLGLDAAQVFLVLGAELLVAAALLRRLPLALAAAPPAGGSPG
ncbi:MAG: MFS transporter [Planctomycetes bacterium]|nr:MFS transporter [Planctomycetota bacterium]MBL7007644.1 MFS transporter [Planctomycetota bacterium]